MDEKRPITGEMLRGFWPVAAILFSMGMTWASLNSKIESSLVAQKEINESIKDTNESVKAVMARVGDHDTDIAVLKNQMTACYSACIVPARVGSAGTNTSASLPEKTTTSSGSSPNRIQVSSESRTESSSQEDQDEPEQEEEDSILEIELPILKAGIDNNKVDLEIL